METKDAGPEEDGYDPSMLCNFCLLNQQKDVKRCRMLSASAGTPDAFVKAMHENDIEMIKQTDYPCLVKNENFDSSLINIDNLIKSDEPSPKGWSDVIKTALQKI